MTGQTKHLDERMRPPHRGLLRLLVLHSLLLGWCALAFVSVRPSAQQQQQQHQQQQQQQHHHHHQQAAAKVYNDDYAWEAQWWPVAFERVTDKTKPHAFELLGKPLVYWWNPVGKQWQATVDTCPHRLAPLSEGRVDGAGCIECPYHGASYWADVFDTNNTPIESCVYWYHYHLDRISKRKHTHI